MQLLSVLTFLNSTTSGYIDLSKRRVYSKDLLQCEERFARAKAINSILRHVAEQLGYETNEQLEELYEKTAWHFDRKLKKKAAAYDIFKKALTYAYCSRFREFQQHFSDPTVFDECEISDDVKQKLLEDIQKKLTPQALKIRADIEVSCFAYEGIEAVKTALAEGKKCSTEEMPIKVFASMTEASSAYSLQINLIAAPLFVVTAQTMERVEGIEAVNNALEVIKKSIESFGGTFKTVMAVGSDSGESTRLSLFSQRSLPTSTRRRSRSEWSSWTWRKAPSPSRRTTRAWWRRRDSTRRPMRKRPRSSKTGKPMRTRKTTATDAPSLPSCGAKCIMAISSRLLVLLMVFM